MKHIFTLADGRRFPCEVLERDENAGMAFVRVRELAQGTEQGWMRWVDEEQVTEAK